LANDHHHQLDHRSREFSSSGIISFTWYMAIKEFFMNARSGDSSHRKKEKRKRRDRKKRKGFCLFEDERERKEDRKGLRV